MPDRGTRSPPSNLALDGSDSVARWGDARAVYTLQRSVRPDEGHAVLHSPALSDQEHEDLLRAIAQAFIMDGLIGDSITLRRIVAYAFRYGF